MRKKRKVNSLQAAASAALKQWQNVCNTPAFQRGVKKGLQDNARQKEVYEKELNSIKHYLAKQGYILPKDFDDFIWWFMGEKYGELLFYEAVKQLPTDADFLEYHNYRESKLKPVVQNTPIVLKNICNNFDATDITTVYQHFKRGLVEKRYLSQDELLSFLVCAFDKQQVPKKRFVLNDVRDKQKIIRVFAKYYKDVAGRPYGKQRQYAALLGEYFTGYTTNNVSTNFSK